MDINVSQLSCFIFCQFSYASYWFIPCFLPFSKWGASAGSGSVSLPNSKIPPLAVVGAIYCFVFPPILFFLSWLLIVWTVTWIYVACFPLWGSLWWKQSGRRVFPSMRPVPPYKASAEWMLSTPPPLRWSCFPRVICLPCFLRVLSGYRWYCQLLRWKGALYWLALPLPLHLPYLRQWPAPLLRVVPSRIHCAITPQVYRYAKSLTELWWPFWQQHQAKLGSMWRKRTKLCQKCVLSTSYEGKCFD